jgi:predicted amidohydrolase
VEISVTAAQVAVTWDVEQNLASIARVLDDARPGEVVVFPEGALSGYGAGLAPLENLDPSLLACALEDVAKLARERAVHVFCGSLIHEDGAWWNAALYFAPSGRRWTYKKINLAMNERGLLAAGDDLPTLEVRVGDVPVTVGVQICREIRFPEQWQCLADAGAQVFVYLTHAAKPGEPSGVWRSHLISRAAENQRWVIAANVAAPHRQCPSMVVSPRGEVVAELAGDEVAVARAAIVPDDAGSWYLRQRRRDVVALQRRAPGD